MSALVEKALARWGLHGASFRLVAARENAVYEVTTPDGPVALRLHRQGYRTDTELRSELAWMAAAAQGGLSVPAPIKAVDGAMLCTIEGTQIDVLSWLDGDTLADVLGTYAPEDRVGLFHRLGHDMARLHFLSDVWTPPPDFQRAEWGREGLLGDAPLWDRFWENPALTTPDIHFAESFRQAATDRLLQVEASLDYGLIHADLVPANVLVDGDAVRLIDFDDGGYGFRLFDVATALHKHLLSDDFGRIRDALLQGYRSVRPLDTTQIDLFYALRAATYVGWNITRMQEPGGIERNQRFIDTFIALAERWMRL